MNIDQTIIKTQNQLYKILYFVVDISGSVTKNIDLLKKITEQIFPFDTTIEIILENYSEMAKINKTEIKN